MCIYALEAKKCTFRCIKEHGVVLFCFVLQIDFLAKTRRGRWRGDGPRGGLLLLLLLACRHLPVHLQHADIAAHPTAHPCCMPQGPA